ncbi:MAG: hypothetical protein EA376_07835 [Phycisphaeraceae bacterium]|nr:MAG: hypothetical protein EA376_07835 [Phycisphaeraceae bacterium]
MMRLARIFLAVGALLIFVHLVRALAAMSGAGEGQFTDALGDVASELPPGLMGSGTSLGLLLLGSWLFGRLFKAAGLPKISGYLVFGLIVGPSALAMVSREHVLHLGLVNDLAIALIALTAGGEMHLSFLRKHYRTVLAFTASVTTLVLAGVTIAMFFIMRPMELVDFESVTPMIIVALMVALVAASGSPAVVIAVITEMKARGPLTQTALSVIVCLDLVLIVLFALVISIGGPILRDLDAEKGATTPAAVHLDAGADVSHTAAAEAAEGDPERPVAIADDGAPVRQSLPVYIAIHLGGSLVVGAVVGLFLAWYVHAVNAHLDIFVVLTCFGIALLSGALGLEPLIVALVAGMLMQNVWPESSEPLFGSVEQLSLPVYCVFFALAGAKVDLGVLSDLWMAAALLVGLRALMIAIGSHAGRKISGLEDPAGKWVWTCFVSQAGVSLALASVIQRSFPGQPFADNIFNLTLAMIAIHELVGPILFKLGLTRAGETNV